MPVSYLTGLSSPFGFLLILLRFDMSRRKRFRFEPAPLIISFKGLSIKSTWITIPGTDRTKISTWGQIKKLTKKAEEILENEQRPFTPNNMAVTMMTLLTVAVNFPSCQAQMDNFTY